jgi:glycosyltransferase involved in cell wall biosynthesis
LRITIVTGFFLPVPALKGGATEKIWHGLATLFAAKGHSVTFISRSWPGQADDETVDGVHHRRVRGFDHTRHLAVNLLLDFAWGVRVALALPPGDVVICNTITLPVWLRWLKPSAGKVAVMIGRVPKGQAAFYGGVARILAPSSFVARRITSRRAAERTRITGYPIEWSRLAASARQSAPPVSVGYVGRIHPEKGIALLIRAARLLAARADLPEWRLTLVGPVSVSEGGGGQDWVEGLRSQAQSLGARIRWLPPEFDPAKLAAVYGEMDIFCYPSLADRGETFGVAVAEAMAARCAAVVSRLDCFGDLVIDGQTGLVFDHEAPDSDRLLADCIGRLIGDGALRRDLAQAGQAHVRRFDYPEVSRRILEDLALLTGAGGENSR